MSGSLALPLRLDLQALEAWLWEAACAIRGPVGASRLRDYILPLLCFKRLSDVLEEELDRLAEELGSREWAEQAAAERRGRVRFYLPPGARWRDLMGTRAGMGGRINEALRAAARENPSLRGVIDAVDFTASTAGRRVLDDRALGRLVAVLSRHRLGLRDADPDVLGRAYEWLLRRFEDRGRGGGEFYTPPEVGILMARLLDPGPGAEIYDPCCGSGGLLIQCHRRLLEAYGRTEEGRTVLPAGVSPVRLFGQEVNPSSFAIARMNALVHGLEADIRLGDTLAHPAFLESDGSLRRFDLVIANPPWNQRADAYGDAFFEGDPHRRFVFGPPPASSADWAWAQHMLASLNEGGRMAILLDAGAVSRGSWGQGGREREIRKAFVEQGLIEAVILLPEGLFYNTSVPGVVLVIGRPARRPGEILLVNAAFPEGREDGKLTEEDVWRIVEVYHDRRTVDGFSMVVRKEEAARRGYNLSPNLWIPSRPREEALPLEEAVRRWKEAEAARAEAARELARLLRDLGLEGIADGQA